MSKKNKVLETIDAIINILIGDNYTVALIRVTKEYPNWF